MMWYATTCRSAALIAALVLAGGPVAADGAGTDSADGLRLAAHDPLQSGQTYQMVQHQQGDRWLLYLGHLRGSELNPLTDQPRVTVGES
jgi:hypothetical protein